MRTGWKSTRLGEVCEIYQPRTISKKEMLEDGPYPVFGANGIIGRYSLYNHEEPQLLITCRGATCGTVNISLPKSWITGNAMVVRPKSAEIDTRYLEYFCRGGLDFSAVITGAAQPQITRQSLTPQLVWYPPLFVQKRIVAILDEAFAGIATAVANTEKNLANARELFKSYLNAVFSNQGEGWANRSIGDICTLKSGTSVGKNYEKKSGDIAYIKVSDMSFSGNDTEILGSSRFLSRRDIGENSIFPIGTTIFPKRGGAIATNKKRLTSIPVCADLNVMGVIPPPNLDPKFLFFYFINIDMGKLGSGSSIPQINNYDIAPLMIAFPTSSEEQGAVVARLEEIRQETDRFESICQQKLNALAELKQSLLQKAFAGELTTAPRDEIESALA